MGYLPKAPDDNEKHLYLDANKKLLYASGIVSYLALCVGCFLFLRSESAFLFYLPYAALTVVYLGLSYALGIASKDFKFVDHKQTVFLYGTTHPSIDVYLPTAGETLEILENTYNHVRKLSYKGTWKVWVLDDSGRDAVRELAEKSGFNYIRRDNLGELKKAGNLRHAFKKTNGELILILDADFCPRTDMLNHMVPYFVRDPNLGILQTPQFFEVDRSQSWVERGASAIQELFYRLIQVNRDEFGGAICVGTNALYRRSALEPFGGTAPIGYSEDVHTGLQVLQLGHGLKYIPLNLAKGTCPDTLPAFFIQQYRWCMGSLSMLFSKNFWATKMSFGLRTSYLSGMGFYLSTALGVLFMPIPSLVVLFVYPEKIHWLNWIYCVPSFLFGIWVMRLWSKQTYSWEALACRQVSYYSHLFAIWDFFFKTATPWVASGSKEANKNTRYKQFRILHILLTNATLLATIIGVGLRLDQTQVIDYTPYLIVVLLNYAINIPILTYKNKP